MQVSRSGSLLVLARRCGPEAARRSVTVQSNLTRDAAPFVIPGRHLPARATVLPPALHGIASRRSSLCGRMRERGFVGTFGAGARLGLHAYAQRTAENLPCALHSQNISLNCDARGAQARGRAAGSCWTERTQRTAQVRSRHTPTANLSSALYSLGIAHLSLLLLARRRRGALSTAHTHLTATAHFQTPPIPCNTAASSPAWATQVLILNSVAALGSAPWCGGARLGLHAKRAKEKT